MEGYIAADLERATRELTRFRHQPIIKALKQNPAGVDVSAFVNVFDHDLHLNDPLQV